MKVTNWTYWKDPNYINIIYEAMKERFAISKAFPFPSLEEFARLSTSEQEKLFHTHNQAMDQAMLEWHNNSELAKIESKLDEIVIEELKKCNYHFTGDMHQNYDFGCPVIDDKYVYCVSTRSWGDLIHRAFPNEDYSQYGEGCEYLKWAWTRPEGEEIILPRGISDRTK